MKDQWDPVSEDEAVYRRVLRKQDYYNPSSIPPIAPLAFRPRDNEDDGISVYRPACGITPELLVAHGRNAAGYIVARLWVRDLLAKPFFFTIRPTKGDPPLDVGHASIVEMTTKSRVEKSDWSRDMQLALAELASRDIIYPPI